jgi:PKD repeat protein
MHLIRAVLYGVIIALIFSFAPAATADPMGEAGSRPETDFYANVTDDGVPAAIVFEDVSAVEGVVCRNWSFGDGTWYNTTDPVEASATHVYATPGSFDVSLNVTSASITGRITKEDYVETFNNRQPISVDNPPEIDGLEVFFNVTHLPGMRSNFTDIRFVRNDSTSIPYWIQGVEDGSHAHIWLALPVGTPEIWMLYNNSVAQDESDPDSVFLVFEDYEMGDLSRWSWYGSNCRIQQDVARSGDYLGDINVSEPDLPEYSNNRICLKNITAGPVVIEGDFRVNAFSKPCGSGYIQLWNESARLYVLHFRDGFLQHYDGEHHAFPENSSVGTDTWYHLKIVVDTRKSTQYVWKDGALLGEVTPRFSDGAPVNESVVFTDLALIGSSAWSSGTPHRFFIDNLIVRRYAVTEPTLSYR